MNNLGIILAGRGELDAAIREYRKVLEIEPDHAEARLNLATALAERGEFDAANAHFQKVLEIKPDDATVHNNFALALARRGAFDLAISHYQRAIEINPEYAEAHNNLAITLARRGEFDAAIARFQKGACDQARLPRGPQQSRQYPGGSTTVGRGHRGVSSGAAIKPRYAEAHNSLATALAERGSRQAIPHFRRRRWNSSPTMRRHTTTWPEPGWPGNLEGAITNYRGKALKIRPNYAGVRAVASMPRCPSGNDFRRCSPTGVMPSAHGRMTRPPLTTSPGSWRPTRMRPCEMAPKLSTMLGTIASARDPSAGYLDTLAAAYAEVGQFAAAVETCAKGEEAIDGREQSLVDPRHSNASRAVLGQTSLSRQQLAR